jgi:hypothetical protein
MAPLPPLREDQQATLRSRAAMLASTAMARIGFGLGERALGASQRGGRTPAISLAGASLRIQDGLLMAFGPDGDPIPPGAFAAIAAEQADTEVALEGGARVPARRVAAVLEAQAKGPLAGQGDRAAGEAWLKAMLGLGPQPVVAATAELRGEDRTCELTIFGRELMLAVPGGRSFLITDADAADQARADAALLAGGEVLSVGDLVLRLRAELEQRPPASVEAGAVHQLAEINLTGCAIERTPDGLVLELPAVGTVRLTEPDQQTPAGPRVSIVLRDGRGAQLADVTAALEGRDTTGHLEDPSAEPEQLATRTGGIAPGQVDPGRALPVMLGLPRVEGVDPDRVVVVIIRGVPQGGVLSAGVDDGDGRWVLSPRQLSGLALTPPPGWREDLPLEVTAVAVRNRAGDFATRTDSVIVPLDAPAETVAPVEIDPALIRAGGLAPDVLMIRGVPAGARLSAGTYDPATNGWVLRPDQLAGLELAAPFGERGVVLTVLGIALGAGGRAEARLLARLPVATR